MIHSKRTYSVTTKETLEDLAKDLYDTQWTLCTGFRIEHEGSVYLFLNDAFSEDGAQEYAVFKAVDEDLWQQVESITVSWIDSLLYMEVFCLRALQSDMIMGEPVRLRLETSERHICPYCM